MRRDRRLQGLSSEHHAALVLSRELARGPDSAATARLVMRLDAELEPHFRVEEELLVPALRAAGEEALVARLEADHAALRAGLERLRAGATEIAAPLGERLRDHVRFEERELFPACEAAVGDAVLDEVARRSPAPNDTREARTGGDGC